MDKEDIQQEMRSLFRALDKDKSRSLDYNEIGNIMAQLMGRPPSQEDLRKCMLMMDKDGNGAIEWDNKMMTVCYNFIYIYLI